MPPLFQQCGYGFSNTPTIAPDANLPSIRDWIMRRVAAYSQNGPPKPHLYPDTRYRPDVRSTTSKPSEQLDTAPSTQWRQAEKKELDLLVDWPFATPEQLSRLMGDVTRKRAN